MTEIVNEAMVLVLEKIKHDIGSPSCRLNLYCAMTLATKIAAQPPLSVAMTKLTVNRLAHALDDLASHMDVDQFALASLTEDHKEGVAAFLERRKPRFKGR